jgi:bifunctional non-homologous end joining protein LigD
VYAHGVAQELVSKYPELATLEVHPDKREDKIFIDYLRNSFGQTAVAPYSARATPAAAVSTPLECHEVKIGLDPTNFTVKTILRRLKTKGDLWKPVLEREGQLK